MNVDIFDFNLIKPCDVVLRPNFMALALALRVEALVLRFWPTSLIKPAPLSGTFTRRRFTSVAYANMFMLMLMLIRLSVANAD